MIKLSRIARCRNGTISYGLSSYGTIPHRRRFTIFTNINTTIGIQGLRSRSFVDYQGRSR